MASESSGPPSVGRAGGRFSPQKELSSVGEIGPSRSGAALAKLKAVHGSKDAAINAELIRAAAPPVQDTAGSQKPAHKPLTKAAEADPKPKRARIAAPARKAATDVPERSGVDVPYAEDVVQKPYQKGSAKPKGGKR